MSNRYHGPLRVALAALMTCLSGAAVADAGSGRTIIGQGVEIIPCATYEVRPGDTLGIISSRIGASWVTAEYLFEINKDQLSAPDLIRVGQVLRTPCHPEVQVLPSLPESDAPDLVAAPSWEARAGDDLVPVLVRWGREAGFDVVVERSSDWRFGVPFRHSGSFRGAVDEVIAGFSTAATPPYVTFYTNNVMTIGAR